MSTVDYEESSSPEPETDAPVELAPTKPKLELEVEISETGPCRKHVKIAVSRTDIERQFDESLQDVGKDAQVPGFRKGHAPRKLLQRRFRKEVSSQVKSALVAASLDQIEKDYKLRSISNPSLDIEAIPLPEDLGPLRFEVDLEVQPDFPTPNYKGLTIKRPVNTISDAAIDDQIKSFMVGVSQAAPKLEGAVESNDLVTVRMVFNYQGVMVKQIPEAEIHVLGKDIRLQDMTIPGFMKALVGTSIGDVRVLKGNVDPGSPDAALRGKSIDVAVEILDIKYYRMPSPKAFAISMGMEDEEELRQLSRAFLEKRFSYQQRLEIKEQVFQRLFEQHPFDLPPEILKRQEEVVLSRRLVEMEQSGLSAADIRARLSMARADARNTVRHDLQEYFLLSRVAEAEELKVEPTDIEGALQETADRSGVSLRRVRAQVEKEGRMDAIAAQALERKALDFILSHAVYEDVPLVEEELPATIEEGVSAIVEDEPPAPADEASDVASEPRMEGEPERTPE